MDPYIRYKSCNNSSVVPDRNLQRLGYSMDDIAYLRQTYGAEPERLSLIALGYSEAEADDILEQLDLIFHRYGSEIRFGECRNAPCSAWRAERVLLGDENSPRFANRIHIFEKRGSAGFGRYLGYVTLRPKVKPLEEKDRYHYVTIANLALPRHMMRPRYHIVMGLGGSHDAVIPFRSVPFCYPNMDIDKPASCLHATIQQALLLKSNSFNLSPVSSLDMIVLLWQLNWKSKENPVLSPAEVEKLALSMDAVADSETSLRNALRILRHSEVNADGCLENFPVKNDSEQAETLAIDAARRCMMDYLANGLPLILAIKIPPEARETAQEADEEKGHSVLVVGMHVLHDPLPTDLGVPDENNIDTRELPDRFVVNDILTGPFSERNYFALLKMAVIEKVSKGEKQTAISFLALTPSGVKVGIGDLRHWYDVLNGFDTRFWKNYFAKLGVTSETIITTANTTFGVEGMASFSSQNRENTAKVPARPRYLIRLLNSTQVIARYFTEHAKEGEKEKKLLTHVKQAMGVSDSPPDAREPVYFGAVEIRLPDECAIGYYDPGDSPPAAIEIWDIYTPLEKGETKSPCIRSVFDGPTEILNEEQASDIERFRITFASNPGASNDYLIKRQRA